MLIILHSHGVHIIHATGWILESPFIKLHQRRTLLEEWIKSNRVKMLCGDTLHVDAEKSSQELIVNRLTIVVVIQNLTYSEPIIGR